MRKPVLKQLHLTFLFVLNFSFGFGQMEWGNIERRVIGDSVLKTNQKVIITGNVVGENGQPLTGATLSLDLLKYFDYSDKAGRFAIECPTGEYRLIVRHIGMLPYYLRLVVEGPGVLNITMQEGVVDLEAIVVSSRARDANLTETIAGVTKFSIPELRTLPTLTGELDIVKNLQTLPGVNSVGEGTSSFNVRGGRGDQNLTLLNGIPLYNTSHALGFVSGFNQDALQNLTFYKGNVPAGFGGRASSVLDVRLRSGDFEQWRYHGGIGLISSRLAAEGPIVPGKTSLMATIRGSHTNWLTGLIRDPVVRESKVGFGDASAVVSHRFNENNQIQLTLYGSSDQFQFSDQFGFNWKNFAGSITWRAAANRKISPLLTLAAGNYFNELTDPSGFDAARVTDKLRYLRLNETVQFEPNDKHSITFGVEGNVYLPTPQVRSPFSETPTIVGKKVNRDHGAEGAVFFQDEIKIGQRFNLSAGLRASGFMHLGPDTVFSYLKGSRKISTISDTSIYKRIGAVNTFGGIEPRLGGRIAVSPKSSIKFGYNRMFQYVHLISNAAAPSPVDLWQVATQYMKPQRTDQFSIGYFRNLKNDMFETSLEFFTKSMENLIEYKDFANLLLNNHLETELLSGKGKAYGAELYINKRIGYWTGWISYTFSRSSIQVDEGYTDGKINNGKWFNANYNRPHHLNLVINRRLGKGGAFSVVSTFNSGRPLTAIETSYLADGVVVPVYSERNAYNIRNYYRLDISITVGSVFKKIDDRFIFSIYNLTGRENPYSVFYKRISSDFFIPSAYQLSIIGVALPTVTYQFTIK